MYVKNQHVFGLVALQRAMVNAGHGGYVLAVHVGMRQTKQGKEVAVNMQVDVPDTCKSARDAINALFVLPGSTVPKIPSSKTDASVQLLFRFKKDRPIANNALACLVAYLGGMDAPHGCDFATFSALLSPFGIDVKPIPTPTGTETGTETSDRNIGNVVNAN